MRLYNDTYNNLRPRLFDGSHLDFPGMNETIRLMAHQRNAIWRCMSAGNTLLAQTVGAGKTFIMAASGMKLRQAGLIKKPLYVVPNHMLEQFAREFMQLYPNAKLLVATKDDLTRERRKFLTAKIASGEWDGIIVTHSSFERIGMSRDYQERFLREQRVPFAHLRLKSTFGAASAVVGASKSAIEALSRYLAVELAPRGIRVNVVSPGVVDTEALRHFPQREVMLREARNKTPSGKLTTPEDVADAVDFLTSDMASAITGHVLVVDGGASLLA